MDYVAMLTLRPTLTAAERDAAFARRANWRYPDGLRLIAEYWPMASAPQVVSIFSTDDPGNFMQLILEWNDVFDINVHPAVSADDGLRLGAALMPNLSRLATPQ
jgi:Protein of unknown function (DUF3303)